MDAEALKIILKLHEENVLLKRAIVDAILMLNKRKKHLVVQYEIERQYVSCLFIEIERILFDFNNRQQPTDNNS
jgi:hypothetical protein